MGCERWREALSAELDGENGPVGQAATQAHLDACVGCQSWYDRAAAVTRRARTTVVTVPPDLAERILAAVPPRRATRSRLVAALRAALGVAGTVQLALGLVQVGSPTSTAGHQHTTGAFPTTPGHLWHESAAWNVAVGAGFLFIALRRTRPTGLLPTLTAFVATLLLLSVNDLVADRVDPSRLVSHGFVLAGYLIIVALSRPGLSPGDPPARRRADTSRWRVRFDPSEEIGPRPALRLLRSPDSERPDPRVWQRRRVA